MSSCNVNASLFDFGEQACYFGEKLTQGIFHGARNLPDSFFDSANHARKNFFRTLREELIYSTVIVGAVGTSILVGQIALRLVGAYFDAYIQNMVGKPRLAIEYKFDNWSSSLSDFIFAPYNIASRILMGRTPKPEKPIFNDEIQEQLDRIVNNTKNVKKNNGIFTNLLLYGPPGTGKTMVSKVIAKSTDMNYVMMSGGDLAQYIKRGEHLSEFNNLFNKIKGASGPTILFIDEAESFAQDRSKLDMERTELLNAFLNQTSSPSKKIMIIAATNRPQELDSAVISRMDDQIYIGPPAPPQRLEILKRYLGEFFKPKDMEEIFTDAYIVQLNNRLEGYSGREIYKLCNALASAKAATPNNTLTHEVLEKTLSLSFKNRQELQQRIQAAR